MGAGTTVAVTAAGRPLGRAVVARLVADAAVDRVVAIDAVAPPSAGPSVDVRPTDVRDPVLASALDGVDALVHVVLPDGLALSQDASLAVAVHGTRNVLAAAERVGVRRLVVVSSAIAYGAHPDNDVPLREDSPLRAAPDFAPAYHQLLAEELAAAWAARHPDVAVSVLRPVTVLGSAVDDLVTRHLESPRLPLVRGLEPPVQFVHLDDVAAAVAVVLDGGLSGAYNVAADGWLAVPEVVALLGRKPLWVPEQVAMSTGRQLWRRGVLPVAPGALRYLMYPWVVSSERLRAAGWSPTRSNREVLREFAQLHDEYLSLGRVRLRRRRAVAGAAAAAGAGGLAGVAALVHWRGNRT